MSYCRHNGVTSDLYLYHDIYGYWVCWCEEKSVRMYTIGDVMIHIQEHKRNGDKVPSHTLERVQREIDEYGIDWNGDR